MTSALWWSKERGSALSNSSRSEAEEAHRHRRGPLADTSRFMRLSVVAALVGVLSCPAHARSSPPLRLRGGAQGASLLATSGSVSPLGKIRFAPLMQQLRLAPTCYEQVASAIGQSLGYGKKPDVEGDVAMGPTTGPTETLDANYEDHGCKVGLPSTYKPFRVEEGPMAESMRIIATQERALLVQASRCRLALVRMDMLQKIMASRQLLAPEAKEVERWKMSSGTLQRQLKSYLGSAGREIAELLGEKSLGSVHEDMADMSSVTPDHHSEDDDALAAAKRRMKEVADGPTIRTKDGSVASITASAQVGGAGAGKLEDATMEESIESSEDAIAIAQPKMAASGKQPTQGPYAPATWSGAASVKQRPSISPPKVVGKPVFAQSLEDTYRVATYEGIPVYGAVKSEDGSVYSYVDETELHLVWDVDQSKLVGEGTNDVELVIKCVLWWKEEMSHDPHFVPTNVPDDIRKDFQQYCDAFDVEKALESVMPLLVRPGAKEFVDAHPTAKWWTFTNKDREVDGQVVRDVSDDDGQVGMFQSYPHEISGRPVVDANKYALQVLDRTACKHLGIQNQERPLIGVRGQRKDMGRVAKLIRKKREREGSMPLDRPVTIVLIDDRKHDAWGNCQANDERFLCHIPAYNAVSEKMSQELVTAMEKILPVETLRKFYCAFREADPTHALIQCVDIMSDDQSMLLKRGQTLKGTTFTYKPKVAQQLPQSLPTFTPAN